MERSAAVLTSPLALPGDVKAPRSDGRAEAVEALAQTERLLRENRYAEAIEALGEVYVPTVSAPDVALRVLFNESWARMYLGELDTAVRVLERARSIAESPSCTDAERAEVMFRLGCCRLKLGKVSNAIALFGSALRLAQSGSGIDAERLRSRIFDWRSRAHQLQREWDAAQVDAERSLELAELVGDDWLTAAAFMQCSLVAERGGNPDVALLYAERGLGLAVAMGDVQAQARLLNNIGGLTFLLGRPEEAVGHLTRAFGLALEAGNDADAAQAVSSLAQVHLRCGASLLAEEQALHALTILGERDDYLDERGNVHLVLGRALLGQDRDGEALSEFAVAEGLFEQLGSTSHTAAAWIAQGDAYRRAGDAEAAMTLFRRAAQALQDFHF